MMDLGRGGSFLHMASHFLLSMLDFWQVPSGKFFLGAASKHFLVFYPEPGLEDSQFDEHIGQMV